MNPNIYLKRSREELEPIEGSVPKKQKTIDVFSCLGRLKELCLIGPEDFPAKIVEINKLFGILKQALSSQSQAKDQIQLDKVCIKFIQTRIEKVSNIYKLEVLGKIEDLLSLLKFDGLFWGLQDLYLGMINNLPKEERKEVISFAKYFCNNRLIPYWEDQLQVVKKIIEANSNERNDVCNLVKKLLPQEMFPGEIIRALHNIAKVHPNEREDVVNRAIERFPKNPIMRPDFLLEISWINVNQRDYVMNFLKGIPVSRAGWLETDFLTRMSKIESKERKNIIDRIKTLIKEDIGFPVEKKGGWDYEWELKVLEIFDKVLPQ